MAFKSMEEFLSMYKSDPDRANKLLRRAMAAGKEPISSKNTGYSKEALARRNSRGFLPGEGNPMPPKKRPYSSKYKRRRRAPVPGPQYPTTR